jgi:hypothetical protein
MRLPIWAPFFCLFLRVFDRALTRLVALARSESYGSESGMLLIFLFHMLVVGRVVSRAFLLSVSALFMPA